MKRLLRFFFFDLVDFFLFILMVALCADVILGVYTRYVMGEALSWYDEVARYLFIWIAFIGAAVAVRRKLHFFIHLIVARLERRMKFVMETLSCAIIMGFSIFLTFQGFRVMEGASAQVSPTLNLNLSWILLVIPIHGVLCFLYGGLNFWQSLKAVRKEVSS